jgi:cell pole-organizing protein PopZ
MTQPAKSQEPSMEEILASIRRIIADEDPADSAHNADEHLEGHASRAAPARAAPPSPEPAAREGGFDSMLARLHASSRPASPASQEPEPIEPATQPAEPARDTEERPAIRGDLREQGLISPATAAAVDAALNTLAEAVQVRNGRTLEEVVTELLRPMLKSWLDDNLPSIVERLVRAEIERVTRGR